MASEYGICIKILELFGVATDIAVADIENLQIYRSALYAHGPVYSFDFQGKHYYIVDDYSLDDRPKLVKDILLDINHLLKGKILENTRPQPDGARFADGLDGIEYYLWEEPSSSIAKA